ncbi:hypothetical protein SAMN05192583_1602 [Sphingomonas gellani]|uniref:Uncharacterized protein n=1 Tax=Sphingomonas gellani TaxID=1166340 RepID=A0A1H8CG56_9SPHN|nr:hypothetical protein [Sphingomonas gellani]SEM94261.1 hypothetical protein SAMN05192583_1602 [Sphingomonas gellani]
MESHPSSVKCRQIALELQVANWVWEHRPASAQDLVGGRHRYRHGDGLHDSELAVVEPGEPRCDRWQRSFLFIDHDQALIGPNLPLNGIPPIRAPFPTAFVKASPSTADCEPNTQELTSPLTV